MKLVHFSAMRIAEEVATDGRREVQEVACSTSNNTNSSGGIGCGPATTDNFFSQTSRKSPKP
eukprot:scaffold12676_cov114-Skeletonema_menzelii.AAC.1